MESLPELMARSKSLSKGSRMMAPGRSLMVLPVCKLDFGACGDIFVRVSENKLKIGDTIRVISYRPGKYPPGVNRNFVVGGHFRLFFTVLLT